MVNNSGFVVEGSLRKLTLLVAVTRQPVTGFRAADCALTAVAIGCTFTYAISVGCNWGIVVGVDVNVGRSVGVSVGLSVAVGVAVITLRVGKLAERADAAEAVFTLLNWAGIIGII